MAFRKGQSGNPKGREKGNSNKNTKLVKDMVVEALSSAGGVSYLRKQATENPNAFLTLVGKLIPVQVGGDENNPVIHEIRRVIVRPDH